MRPRCMIKIFMREGVAGVMDGVEGLMNLYESNLEGVTGKGKKLFVGREKILKVSPPLSPPPNKILIVISPQS